MSVKIEAGKAWMIEKQGDYFIEKSGILLPGGLIISSPAILESGLKQKIVLHKSWDQVQVWSDPAYSVVKGHLPGKLVVAGQVLHHSLSPIYGIRTFSLIGVGATISWGEVGADDYMKVENTIDLPGEVISK